MNKTEHVLFSRSFQLRKEFQQRLREKVISDTKLFTSWAHERELS